MTFRFTLSYILFTGGAVTLGILIVLFSSPLITFHEIVLFCFFLVFVWTFELGTYCYYDHQNFYKVSFFFIKTKIPFLKIKEVKYESSWIFPSKSMKSLYVIDKEGKSITMSEIAYGEKALKEVMKLLEKM